MRQTSFLNLDVPEPEDDVLVQVLGTAFDALDTAIQLSPGNNIDITTDTGTKVQTVAVVPCSQLVSSSETDVPSSAAVAGFVQDLVSGQGSYQGQYGCYGTLAQIQAFVPPDTAHGSGVYIDANQVFLIEHDGTAWGTGVPAASQVAGNSYDIRALLDYPATGGGYESGQIRLVVQDGTLSFVVTGQSQSVRSVSATGNGIAVDNSDPFNPSVSLVFGGVGAGVSLPVTGSTVAASLTAKQQQINGTSGNAILFGSSPGSLQSRPITSLPVEDSNSLITSGGVYDALLTLEGEQWIVSFAQTQPEPQPGELILWLHA